jgi:hypothetical protein
MRREEVDMFAMVQVLMSYARDRLSPQNMPKALRLGISRAEIGVRSLPKRFQTPGDHRFPHTPLLRRAERRSR